MVKNSSLCTRFKRNGLDPWSGRSPGIVTGNPLQYSYLENSMDKRTCGVTVHGVAKNQTRLSAHTHTHTHTHTVLYNSLTFSKYFHYYLI